MKKLKLYATAGIGILVSALFIFELSEFIRGMKPLYGYLKMFALFMMLASLIVSILNAFELIQIEAKVGKRLPWIFVSLVPSLFFLYVLIPLWLK